MGLDGTFRPSDVIATFNGIPIDGFAPDTFIAWERNNDSFNLSVGSGGRGARAASSDRSGRVTITLMATAPENGALAAIQQLDENTGDGVGPLAVKDLSGLDALAAATAWLVRPADGEMSNEIGTREWIFETDDLEVLLGGNPA